MPNLGMYVTSVNGPVIAGASRMKVSYGLSFAHAFVCGAVTQKRYFLRVGCHVAVTAPTRPCQVKTGRACSTPATQPLPPQNCQLPASLRESGSAASKPWARATKMPSPLIQVQFSVAASDRQPPATMYSAPSGLRTFSGPWSTTCGEPILTPAGFPCGVPLMG